MRKKFNVTANCRPDLHYMVDISEQLCEIKEYVDQGEYFTINRARQYGKTTTLHALGDYLKKDYIVISMDFQMLGASSFKDELIFSYTFASYLIRTIRRFLPDVYRFQKEFLDELQNAIQGGKENLTLFDLFDYLSRFCEIAEKPVVLMIDEVDSATNNQVFLDFLAQLRAYYIVRNSMPTFHSVILAGVYDVKNLKAKIRPEVEHKKNSPKLSQGLYFWNIAADFYVDMSLPESGIAGMLDDYEEDYSTGMDIQSMASLIYAYTSGYPYLVSRICKLIDERIAGNGEYPNKSAAWTKGGFLAAIRILLTEQNTLFESLTGKLDTHPQLNEMLFSLLFTGEDIEYVHDTNIIAMAAMYGFIKNRDGKVAMANRIFETRIYNRFLSTMEMQQSKMYKASLQDKNQFVIDGYLNMRLVLEKFVQHFHDLYGDSDDKFLEEDGRRYFLLYLRPIINGIGNYYVEAQTRDMKRTDVIIDYRGKQQILEMKIWHGKEYNNRGEDQLIGYLNEYHQKKGYMLSFNFNKKKEIGVREINIGDKVIIEAVV